MDNLTHSLTAVTLSRAGLNRLVPRATLIAVLGANMPDIDIVAGLAGATEYLVWHRGWTHALALAPLIALPPLLLWAWLARDARRNLRLWLFAYLVSLLGVLSHAALDCLNVYGVRLLLPFSGAWLRLDAVHIIDIWVWALLLAGTLGPLLGRLVAGEIGAPRGSGRTAAVVTLVLLAAYLGARVHLHRQALLTLDARLYDGAPARSVAAFPSPFNPFMWRTAVETGRTWRAGELNLNQEYDPEAGRVFYKPASQPEFDAARATRTLRAYLDFSQIPIWQLRPARAPAGALEVSVTDLRFGLPEERRFHAAVTLDAALRPLTERFAFDASGTDPR